MYQLALVLNHDMHVGAPEIDVWIAGSSTEASNPSPHRFCLRANDTPLLSADHLWVLKSRSLICANFGVHVHVRKKRKVIQTLRKFKTSGVTYYGSTT